MVNLWSFWQGRRRTGGPSQAANREAGYNLVVLVVMVTVLNIVIAKALPLWSTVIQRQKEEELIFRGMQYAEAIRVFEARHKRMPVRLKELVEVEPRAIRQLWTNPMVNQDEAEEDETKGWGLIFQNQPTPNQRNQRNQRIQRGDQDRSSSGEGRFGVPGGGKEVKVGPIFGVYSPEGGEAIKVFVANPNASGGGGGTEISEWRFTVDLAKVLVKSIDPQNPIAPSMNAADFGKPWPPGVQPQNLPDPSRGTSRGRGRNPGIAPVIPGQGGVPGRQSPAQPPAGKRPSGGERGGG